MSTEFNYTQNIANVHQHTKKHIKVDIQKVLLGLFLFVSIFIITIPYILFKYSYYTILEAYLPNVDLIANILTWHKGPFGIWEHLYPPTPLTIYGFSSKTVINYVALLGLTYIVVRETKRTNSIIKGWSLAFVMLLITYLLPNQFVSWVMDKSYDFLKVTENISLLKANTLTVLLGGFFTICIILIETFILRAYRKNIENVVNKIIHIPKLLKKII